MFLENVEKASLNTLFKFWYGWTDKRFFENALLMKVASLIPGNAEINDT
jgi:hypothetical protein